jgi:phage terminase large subunit-like protein
MGLRLGPHPQIFWTGTPKPKPFIRNLVKLPRSIVINGSTYENRDNLPRTFFENVAKYEGTAVGRQELYGEILDPEEAGFVKRSQWRLWPASKKLPKFRLIVMSLDTAFTEKQWDKKEQTGDPTACSVWGIFTYERTDHIMLLDAWEDYLGFPALIKRVKIERNYTYGDQDEPVLRPLIDKMQRPRHQGRPVDLILLEDKGSGISLRQQLAVEEILTESYNPEGMDKLSRLHACSPLFPHGRVWAVESLKVKGEPRNWADPLISQVCTYVGEGSLIHDDLLDSATQAWIWLMHRFDMKFTVRDDPQVASQKALDKLHSRHRRNPYDGRGR